MNTESLTIQALSDAISEKLQENLGTFSLETVSGKLADKITVSTMDVSIPFSYPITGLSELLGQKDVRSLDFELTSTKCKPFERTIGVSSFDLSEDKLGIYKMQIDGVVNAAKMHYDSLIVSALSANSACAGGTALFSDTQTWKGLATAQDNNLALSLSETNLETAYSTMVDFKDPYGNVLGVKPNVLLVPPSLEFTARKLVAPVNSSGGYNAMAGLLEVVVLKGLPSTSWYLVDSQHGKPFVIIEKDAAYVSSYDDTFKSKKIYYSVELTANVANGFWCNILRSTP